MVTFHTHKCEVAHLCTPDSAVNDGEEEEGEQYYVSQHHVTMHTHFFSKLNSQGGDVMKSACLPFITVKWGIKTKETEGGWRRGGQSRGAMSRAGKHREVYMKNRTFPLIISVTSPLNSGTILNICEDAEYTLMGTLIIS